MKVLIYGATGYLGINLAKKLISKGYEVANVSRRSLNLYGVINYSFDDDIKNILSDFCPNKLIYLSAAYDNESVELILKVNYTTPVSIVSALAHNNECEFIYIGSYWQLGDYSLKNIPINMYSASKKATSVFLDYCNAYTDVKCKEVILYGTYGSKDSRGKIIDILIDAAENDKVIDISEGNQELNLSNVNHVCDALISVLHNKDLKVQVLSTKTYTLREVVCIINNYKQLRVNFGAIPYRKVELMKLNVSTEYKPIYIQCSLNADVKLALFKT